MKRYMLSLGVALAVACATLSAQTSTMAGKKTSKMAKATSLTGCVENGSSGTFMLSHVTSKVTKKTASAGDMSSSDHAGMSDQVHLMGSAVDFSKHVGHKVTVKGTKDGDTLNVKSVKMISDSCS